MTYYSNNYSKEYSWTAFKETDLLANGKNGSDFGKGDTFVVTKATTKMSTYDDERTLSNGYSWWGKNYSSDQYGQDAYVNGASVGSKMYAERYHTLKGSDGCVYYMIEIKVEGSSGTNGTFFTFYGAQPKAGVTLTNVGVTEVVGSWVDYSCLGAGTSAPANTPPTFTNVPSNGIFTVNENTKFVVDLNATDKDGDALSFSIVGGTDAKSFVIDAKTGELNFKAAPDYEKPGSSDGDNTYKVIVAVNDGRGGVTNQELTVKVADVNEGTGNSGTCIVVEAEKMTLKNYCVGTASSASGNQYIQLSQWNGNASTKFSGDDGKYDFTMRYWDASLGDAQVKVYVNGKLVGSVTLNANNNNWSEIKIEGLQLNKGDVVTLQGYGSGCDLAIIDKITFCPVIPEVKPGTLEGRVFIDANKDGIDNNETGIAGVTVTLLTAAGAVVATTTTSANGSYRFDGLNPGDYKVVFPTTVDGRVLTEQNVGNDDRIDSDANVSTGQTGNYTVTSGGLVSDVDAGVKDPGTAKLGDKVFLDSNGNGVQDAGEAGVQGVNVVLYDVNGNVIGATSTDANGNYLFNNLDAGSYSVGFTALSGYTFTTANAGSDDTRDSDVDQGGRTGQVQLGLGETNLTVDAGLVKVHVNTPPDAVDDTAKACADEAKTVDVLANDKDVDGDTLTITKVNGQSINAGGTVNVDGVTISLVDGKLVFDASQSSYAQLLVGDKAQVSYTYEIADGKGGFDTAKVDMTYCGSLNTLETIKASLPNLGGMVVTFDGTVGGELTSATISGTGDERFDGLTFDAYCVNVYDATNFDTSIPFKMYLADEAVSKDIVSNPQNLDMVNWILNQDFTSKDNGDGTSTTYTEAEIQGAIWGLTDDFIYVGDDYGSGNYDNAKEIYDLAMQFGEGFEAGEGDIVGLILDPTDAANAEGNHQPMIIAVNFDDLSQDCLCL